MFLLSRAEGHQQGGHPACIVTALQQLYQLSTEHPTKETGAHPGQKGCCKKWRIGLPAVLSHTNGCFRLPVWIVKSTHESGW